MSNLPKNAISHIKTFLTHYQNTLCKQMESLDHGSQFLRDVWNKSNEGGGLSCVLSQGTIFEKAGINFSHIYGSQLPPAATQNRPELQGRPYEVLGVSLVFHPMNPFVPTTHANIRFFSTTDTQDTPVWWFGGGFDLTPYYPFEEDCQHWHQMARQATHPFEDTLYPKWKKWCDDYFFLAHRQETRGIGGLFFDDFHQPDFETCFNIFQNVGIHFWKAYEPIVLLRKDHSFNQAHKEFQKYRRGRYVEFNLLYDRGTLFGLQSQGRTESILMSMPPEVNFKYNWHPAPNSPEAKLYQRYLQPQEWL